MRGAWRGAVIALLVGFTGCGASGSGEATTHGATLTKRAWVAKANEVCGPVIDRRTRGMEAFYKAHGVHGNPNLHQREAANTAVVVPNVQQRVEVLEALPVPSGGAAKVREFLKALEEGKREAKSHPYNLAKPEAPIPFHRSAKLGTELGLVFCGEP